MTPKTFLDKLKMAVIMIAVSALIIFLASCEDDRISNVGCFYAYPSDGDPYEIIGCGTEGQFNNTDLPTGYDRMEWQPIEDCSLCARRDPRGG